MRSLILCFALSLGLAACTADPFVGPAPQGVFPIPPPGAAAGSTGGGAGAAGSPAPALAGIAFDDSFLNLGVAGGFPSDLVLGPGRTFFTVDDATVPMNVVGFAGGALTLSVPITANELIDMDGTTPAQAPGIFGPGLFGAFSGDMELALGRWLLVTVGAGNSASAPVRLANLVVIDTQARRVVQTVNLAWTLRAGGQFSNGGPYDSIPQSLPVMCKYVRAQNGTPTGKIYVAMSNGAGSTAGLGSFYAGTVQVWRADFSAPVPLRIETTGKQVTDVTRTHLSSRYNPVGLTRYTAQSGVSFLILTNAGASRFDANFTIQPTTDAFLEFLDLDRRQWRPDWEVNLGRILPAPQDLALGRDLVGKSFGMFSSQTFAAIYAVELSGLESNPVVSSRLRMLRTAELAPGGSTTAGSGFQPGLALSPSLGSAVISSFTNAALMVLEIPGDIEFGRFQLNPAPFDINLSSAQALGLGALVVDAQGDAFVIANGNSDQNFVPRRPAFIGRLTTGGRLP